jgi:hypothetical protein
MRKMKWKRTWERLKKEEKFFKSKEFIYEKAYFKKIANWRLKDRRCANLVSNIEISEEVIPCKVASPSARAKLHPCPLHLPFTPSNPCRRAHVPPRDGTSNKAINSLDSSIPHLQFRARWSRAILDPAPVPRRFLLSDGLAGVGELGIGLRSGRGPVYR